MPDTIYPNPGPPRNQPSVGQPIIDLTAELGKFGITISNNFSNNTVLDAVSNYSLESISELYSKNYSHILSLTSNGKIKIEWTDTFGDTNIIRV